MMDTIQYTPFLPVWLIALLGSVTALVSLMRVRQHPLGTALRLIGILITSAFLMGPIKADEEATPLDDIALVIVDHSRSTAFGDRQIIATSAAARLTEQLTSLGVDVRTVEMHGTDRTSLGEALTSSLMDIPRDRLSAISVITDGRIHGSINPPSAIPLHTLLVGNPETQVDRRIDIVRSPRFGVVDETVEVVLRLESENEEGAIPSTLRVNGQPFSSQALPLGEDVTVTVPLTQPGDTIIELTIEELPDELTYLNNRAVVELTAVRDRLRVLLVSGEPHAGERVWRNTLKSDPSVDLVHFTILKPGNKIAIAAPDELNLIEFPHEELFLDKLSSFDVVIFDRYTYRGVLQPFEFEEIARYVEEGGAILIAAGPEMATSGSIAAHQSLAYMLPALATGTVIEDEFIPTLTDIGRRHPVTASLPDPEAWGRWVRRLPGVVRQGHAILSDEEGNPLLVIDRIRNGRIAILLSDQIWLWAREFDGGGPHRELLRRLIHWLMQEPELEEESLSGILRDGTLRITRQSLSADVDPVTLTHPDGTEELITLEPYEEGKFAARINTPDTGLYRLSTTTENEETLYALVHDGLSDREETRAVTTTDALMRDIAHQSGGYIGILENETSPLATIRRDEPPGNGASNALHFPQRKAQLVTSLRSHPLLPRWIWLLLITIAITSAWLIEGRQGKS